MRRGKMTLWERRAARNQALFREVNERVEEQGADARDDDSADFVCECADDTCTERITVPLTTYERVRRSPRLFIMRRGHQQPELDRVIEERADFVIVSKDKGEAARIAEETAPR
jgi:hypothetical protein